MFLHCRLVWQSLGWPHSSCTTVLLFLFSLFGLEIEKHWVPPLCGSPAKRPSPVAYQGLQTQLPLQGSRCSFALSSPVEPSGPTPCTAAATCAGSPAGSRQDTRSQALPAALGPLTWKASCCSPPPPRSLSAKVRGARAVCLAIRVLLRQGSRCHGETGCLLPHAQWGDAL